jgi:hypothetical protein
VKPAEYGKREERELASPLLSDYDVSGMNSITQRELNRKPSLASALQPGESIAIKDRKGGLVLTRLKQRSVTVADMEAALDRLAPRCPPLDTKAFLEESE